MGRTVTIKISGRGTDTDAPKAEDLLDQIRDYLDILRGVEEAVAGDGPTEIDWRITNATKASPIAFVLEAFPKKFGMDITSRVGVVATATAEGLAALQRAPKRPAYFRDDVLRKAERTFERVTNGLDLSEVDFGPGTEHLRVTATIAKGAAKNAEIALMPTEKPYHELGSIDGIARAIEIDGRNRRILIVRHRLTGDDVKCILSGKALDSIGQSTVGDVYKGLRVIVRGTILYKGPGQIGRVKATEVSFARNRTDLPSIDDILDENFTGGLRSEEYLERLRDGRL